MTKNGHFKTGVGIALGASSAVYMMTAIPAYVITAGVTTYLTSSLPDNMEIKWWSRGVRHSLIEHRTMTHWLPLWVVAVMLVGHALWTGQAIITPIIDVALFGMFCGGLGHVLMDMMTPMGVPVGLNPFRRKSLRVFRSGSAFIESLAACGTLVVGLGVWLYALGFASL